MNDKEFLRKRADRAMATILGFKEKECDYYLPQEVSVALRKVVLDQINDLVELSFDMISDDVIYNEFYWDKLDRIQETLDAFVKE